MLIAIKLSDRLIDQIVFNNLNELLNNLALKFEARKMFTISQIDQNLVEEVRVELNIKLTADLWL